jgi:hypothetical protein
MPKKKEIFEVIKFLRKNQNYSKKSDEVVTIQMSSKFKKLFRII